jgi:putative tryptophan/tyrosine transport system substrate-binding protein
MLARGQQSIPIIGILGSSAADDYGPMITAFRKGLSETGYLEGRMSASNMRGLTTTMIDCLR